MARLDPVTTAYRKKIDADHLTADPAQVAVLPEFDRIAVEVAAAAE